MLPRHSYPFPSLTSGQFLSVGPLVVRPDYLIMLAAMLAITATLHLLLYRTRFGLGLRAIIENSLAASLSGIDVRSTMLKAFALASAIGGVAGFLVLSANQQVTAMLGMWATLKGLIAMMIGGLGSIQAQLSAVSFSASSKSTARLFRAAGSRPRRLWRAVRPAGAAAGRHLRHGGGR